MRKNGFTLIELLAVIVILAIIALIATPIILGIINDAREKANERSVELYASAVRNGIAAYQLREGKEVEAKTYTKDTLPFEVEYDGKVDCENVIISEDGKVSLDKCTVNGGTKEYSYGIEENTVAKVCTIEQQDESKYSVGDVVTCNIGEIPDKFYVIADTELTASTIQMLTEKNIHTTSYRQSDNAGTTAFSSINYWSDETTYPVDVYGDYKDAEGNQQNLVYPIVEEYVSYLNGTLIEDATGSLLTYNQAESLGCSGSSCSSAPTWVYSTNYRTGSAADVPFVWMVCADGHFRNGVFYYDVGDTSDLDPGVRPVITISTSEIQ